jgi:hypothetical protein
MRPPHGGPALRPTDRRPAGPAPRPTRSPDHRELTTFRPPGPAPPPVWTRLPGRSGSRGRPSNGQNRVRDPRRSPVAALAGWMTRTRARKCRMSVQIALQNVRAECPCSRHDRGSPRSMKIGLVACRALGHDILWIPAHFLSRQLRLRFALRSIPCGALVLWILESLEPPDRAWFDLVIASRESVKIRPRIESRFAAKSYTLADVQNVRLQRLRPNVLRKS